MQHGMFSNTAVCKYHRSSSSCSTYEESVDNLGFISSTERWIICWLLFLYLVSHLLMKRQSGGITIFKFVSWAVLLHSSLLCKHFSFVFETKLLVSRELPFRPWNGFFYWHLLLNGQLGSKITIFQLTTIDFYPFNLVNQQRIGTFVV